MLPPLLLFKGLLRALGCRFKARRPHLRRGPPLLLQNIASEFLLGHGLTRSAKSARANGLRRNALLRKLPLPRNIGQRLLHGSILKLPHKRRNLRRIKPPAGAGQRSNALLRGGCAHARGAHERLLGRGRRSTRPSRRKVCADLRAADLTANAACSTPQPLLTRHGCLLSRADAGQKLAYALLPKTHAGAKALLQHLVCCRLRLEGQTALRSGKLRGLVDKALTCAGRAERLLQCRGRLPRNQILALTNHLRSAGQERGVPANALLGSSYRCALRGTELSNLVIRRSGTACNALVGKVPYAV